MNIDPKIIDALKALVCRVEKEKYLLKSSRISALCEMVKDIQSLVAELKDCKTPEDFFSMSRAYKCFDLYEKKGRELVADTSSNKLTGNELSFLVDLYNLIIDIEAYCSKKIIEPGSLLSFNQTFSKLSASIVFDGPEKKFTVDGQEFNIQEKVLKGKAFVDGKLIANALKVDEFIQLDDEIKKSMRAYQCFVAEIPNEVDDFKSSIEQIAQLKKNYERIQSMAEEAIQTSLASDKEFSLNETNGKLELVDLTSYHRHHVEQIQKITLDFQRKIQQLESQLQFYQKGKKAFNLLERPSDVESVNDLKKVLASISQLALENQSKAYSQGFISQKEKYKKDISPKEKSFLENEIISLDESLVQLRKNQKDKNLGFYQTQIDMCRKLLEKYSLIECDLDSDNAELLKVYNGSVKEIEAIKAYLVNDFEKFKASNLEALSADIDRLTQEKESLVEYETDKDQSVVAEKLSELEGTKKELYLEESRLQGDCKDIEEPKTNNFNDKILVEKNLSLLKDLVLLLEKINKSNAKNLLKTINCNEPLKLLFDKGDLEFIEDNITNINSTFSTKFNSTSIDEIKALLVTVHEKELKRWMEISDKEVSLDEKYRDICRKLTGNVALQADFLLKFEETSKQQRYLELNKKIVVKKETLVELKKAKVIGDVESEFEKARGIALLDLSDVDLESTAESINDKLIHYIENINKLKSEFEARVKEIKQQAEKFGIDLNQEKQRVLLDVSIPVEHGAKIAAAQDYKDLVSAKHTECKEASVIINANKDKIMSLITKPVSYLENDFMSCITEYKTLKNNAVELRTIPEITEIKQLPANHKALNIIIANINSKIVKHNVRRNTAIKQLDGGVVGLEKIIKEYNFSKTGLVKSFADCLPLIATNMPELVTSEWLIKVLKQIGQSDLSLEDKKTCAKLLVEKLIGNVDSIDGLNELVVARKGLKKDGELNYIFKERGILRGTYGNTATWQSIMGNIKDRIDTLTEKQDDLKQRDDFKIIMSAQRGRGFLFFSGATRFDTKYKDIKKASPANKAEGDKLSL